MKKDKKGDKKVYIFSVIVAIILLCLLLVFVNVQDNSKLSSDNKSETIPTTTRKIIKDKLTIDDKTVDIEVEEYNTTWGITVKYEPLYFKVGADDKLLKFTSVVDKNTYVVIEKLTESEYNKAVDLNKNDDDGEYTYIRRVIKNGQVYLKVTKCHKIGVEYDDIDARMEYILQQLS